MTVFPLASSALHAYLVDESLLVYSEKTQNVYGFEQESAALFLHIDEMAHSMSLETLQQHFPAADPQPIARMYALATGLEPPASLEYEEDLQIGDYPAAADLPRLFYRVDDTTFAIHYPSDTVKEKIHPVIAHLYSEQPTERKIAVDLIRKGDTWEIHWNGQAVEMLVPDPQLATFLQEKMMTSTYQSHPYLICLHAAAVEYNGAVFVFPATAESGKTTLTAALLHAGFKLFSDENCSMDEQGMVQPLPFCMNIKEGSWNILANRYPGLAQQPYHHRFDGQKIKFLNPLNLHEGRKKATHLIFPKYKPGSAVHMRPLSAVEALAKIKEASYQVQNDLGLEKFEAIVQNLLMLPKFLLEFSDLNEAVQTLKKLS